MSYLKFGRNFSLPSAHSQSLLTHSGFIASRSRKIITKSASSWIASCIDMLMSTLSGTRTAPSAPIYIWAVSSVSLELGRGFILVTMANEYLLECFHGQSPQRLTIERKRVQTSEAACTSSCHEGFYSLNLKRILINVYF